MRRRRGMRKEKDAKECVDEGKAEEKRVEE